MWSRPAKTAVNFHRARQRVVRGALAAFSPGSGSGHDRPSIGAGAMPEPDLCQGVTPAQLQCREACRQRAVQCRRGCRDTTQFQQRGFSGRALHLRVWICRNQCHAVATACGDACGGDEKVVYGVEKRWAEERRAMAVREQRERAKAAEVPGL